MKRLILLFAALVITGQAFVAKSQMAQYRVTSADEFLNALGSDRVIYLDAGYYDLTAALLERPDLFVQDEDNVAPNVHVYFTEQFDGPELHVRNVKNLRIAIGETEATSLLIDPRYAFVIMFESCSELALEGVTFGHTEAGYCDRGVLGFDDCQGVHILECDLFGCGTEGIVVSNCNGFVFENSKIRDCTYHIMHITGSTYVSFVSSQFFRNHEFEQVNITECDEVEFNNCIFANNEGPLFNVDSSVVLNNCVILHDLENLGDGTWNINCINCIIEEYFAPVG